MSSMIPVVISCWETISLDKHRSEWDEWASQIVENKDNSVVTRKKLSIATKSFKSIQDQEEKLRCIGTLLKSYQDEVDRLTSRSKYCETAFVSIYRLFAEAVDPVDCLKLCVGSEKVFEEKERLRDELDRFKSEFKEIQNQEITIRRLEEKLSLKESEMEEEVKKRMREWEATSIGVRRKVEDEMKEREAELVKGVGKYENELVCLRNTLESVQRELADSMRERDMSQSSKQNELDMLSEELDRSLSRILQLEREKEKIGGDSSVSSSSLAGDDSSSTFDQLELVQKEIAISQLREELTKKESELRKHEAIELEHALLKEQLREERSKSESLQGQLKAAPSFEQFNEIRRQLRALKRVEFDSSSWSESDKGGKGKETGNELIDEEEEGGLERMLIQKNRRLETRLMQQKVLLSETQEELDDVRASLEANQEKQSDLESLVQKLEDDIAGQSRGSSDTQQLDSVKLQTQVQKQNLQQTASNNNVLQMVCHQRDRFKSRILDLESESKRLSSLVEQGDNRISALQQDNVKLYEKIRYLQSYRSVVQSDPHPSHRSSNDRDVENRYSELYEESMDPFVLFNRKERHRRYDQLNAAEKVILKTGKFFLSTKMTRTALFFYSIALHVLVFLTLYKLAHSSVPECFPMERDYIPPSPTG